MLQFLPGPIHGLLSIIIFTTFTLFWGVFLFLITITRIIIPLKKWHHQCYAISIWIAENWLSWNLRSFDLTKKIDWDIRCSENLELNDWYLVLANHQTWTDIIVLEKLLFRKIPFLRFFLKKELIWVPILGPAWWILEFPFMQRYSKSFLQKNPHLKNQDLEATRQTCEKYKNYPVSIMNFPEGTRFTKEKLLKQLSPFKNMLKPKAGGISFVLNSMNGLLHKIIDVTIFYPEGVQSFWSFFCGKVSKIVVRVNIIPIPDELRGDYSNDPSYRAYFQKWLNELWADKDILFETELKEKNIG